MQEWNFLTQALSPNSIKLEENVNSKKNGETIFNRLNNLLIKWVQYHKLMLCGKTISE